MASGPLFSLAAELTVYDDRLFFRAYTEDTGHELWTYDAATGETALIADIEPTGDSYPNQLTVYDGKLFFAARDAGANEELWQYDAATGETTLAADVSQMLNGSLPRDLTLYDGRLFFSVLSDNYDRELWTYDAATEEVSFIAGVSMGMGELGGMAVIDGRLFFAGGTGHELWVYDAATDTTATLARGINPLDLTPYAGRLFFSGNDTTLGRELWAYSPLATDTEPTSASGSTNLSAPYPNPTRDIATVAFTLVEPQHVRLTVYDALGREVAVLHDGVLPADEHAFRFDGSGLPNGLYFIQAVGDTVPATQRVTIVR